jgi:hypothetical protein
VGITADFGIKLAVDSKDLNRLFEDLARLQSMMGSDLVNVFKKTSAEVGSEWKKQSEIVQKTSKEIKSAALSAGEVQERIQKSIAESSQHYDKLKAEYSKKSLDEVREQIMAHEEATRVMRQARANETDKIVKKELQAETNKVNTELQLFRSLEKEKVGRTFTEMMERLHLAEKTDKDIVELEQKVAKEREAIEHQITQTIDTEEKKRLSFTLQTIKAEESAIKKEASERGSSAKHGSEGKSEHGSEGKSERGGGGSAILNIAGVGAAIEGFKLLREKSEEAADAQKKLIAGTGLTGKALEEAGKDAEDVGRKFAISGEVAKVAMGKVSSYTGATGEELKKQTEAVIAYGAAHGKEAEMVAKMFATEKGRAKILSEANYNIAKSQEAANTPAANMARIQNELMETVGKVAMVVLDALGPAISAVVPIITVLGDLITDTVKPIFEKLTPIISALVSGFKPFVSIITELITTGLEALAPVLENIGKLIEVIAPVVMGVVKSIADALMPVFKALMPVISTLVGLLSKEFITVFQDVLVPLLQDVVVPIIRDLLAPVLLALMPLIQMIADLLVKVLVPIFTGLGSTIKWLMDNAIGPLIKLFSGALTETIKAVTGVVKEIVGAIGSLVDAVGSVLSIGSDAPAKVKKTGTEVAAADAQNHAILTAQQEKQHAEKMAALKKQALEKIKYGKLSTEEENDLREQAQEDGDDAMLAKLDAFDKKRASAGKHAAAAAHKETKSAFDTNKELEDSNFDEQKILIETNIAKGLVTEAEGKRALLNLQKEHDEKMLALLTTYKQKTSAANLALAKDVQAIRKEENAADLEALKQKEQDALEADELRIANTEGATSKEFEIKKQALLDEIALIKQQGDDTLSLQKALASLERSHKIEELKGSIAIQKELVASGDSARIDAMKQNLDRMKGLHSQGVNNTRDILQQETAIAIEEEKIRFDKLRKDRESDLKILSTDSAETQKAKHLLEESLEADHQGKMSAIAEKGAREQQKIQIDNVQKITAPLVSAYQTAADAIAKKFGEPISKMFKSHQTLAGDVMASITQDTMKMLIQVGEQQLKNLITSAATSAGIIAQTTTVGAVMGAALAPAALSMSIATLGVADATGLDAYTTALASAQALTKVTALASGGILDSPTYSRNGRFLAGEAGPEAVIPLNSSRGQDVLGINTLGIHMDRMNGLLSKQNEYLGGIHSAATTPMPHGSPSSMYQAQAQIQQASSIVNRRRLG